MQQTCSTLFETIFLQTPKCEQLLSFCPRNIRSSLSHNSIGVIFAFSNDALIVFTPVITESDVKFMVFSKKVSPLLDYSNPSFRYISRRRWNQRSVSEVDLNILNTFNQIEVNLQLTKFSTYHQDFVTDKRMFISSCCIINSLPNLLDLSFIALVNSRNLLYLFKTSLSDDGLRNNLGVTNLSSTLQDFLDEIHLVKQHTLLCTDSYKIMCEKIYCSSVVASDLSKVFTDPDGLYYILLASGKRDGGLYIWQLNISPAFLVTDIIIKHQCSFLSNSLTWIEKLVWSGIYRSNMSFLVLNFVDGTIRVVCFSINSGQFSTCEIISESDSVNISQILWSPHEDIPTLFFIKGSAIFMVTLLPDYENDRFNSSIVHAYISSFFPINSLDFLFNNFIVISFQNCTFAIFAIYQFSLILLTAESIGFSEYIHDYIVEHISTIPRVVEILFSPYSLYMMMVYIGTILSEHIDCLTYSRSSIIFIPLFNIPFFVSNIRKFASEFLQWDMVKCYLLCRRQDKLKIFQDLFPTMPKISLLKLKYIFDVSYDMLCPSASIIPLLKQFNAEVQSAILNNYSLETDYRIFFNFEDKLIGKHCSDVCEICDLSLHNDEFNIAISCLGKHTFDRCLFTFEIIHTHDEFLFCFICNRKILKYAFKLLSILFGLSVQVLCPLCNGVFVQCSLI